MHPILDPLIIYDAYLIAADDRVAVPARIVETDKKGKRKDKGRTSDLNPKPLLMSRYFAKEQVALDAKQVELEATLKRAVRDQDAVLDELAYARYAKLTETEIKTLVAGDKWMTRLSSAVQVELDRVSQTLTGRIRELSERYATPLPRLTATAAELEARIAGHLQKMGFPT